jgi:hypothetical protein
MVAGRCWKSYEAFGVWTGGAGSRLPRNAGVTGWRSGWWEQMAMRSVSPSKRRSSRQVLQR